MITSKELREKWIKFYESKGHVNIGAVSLIGDGTTGVMFNVAGMQPLMPYLLSFAAGAMIYVVVEELVPEMSGGEHSNIGTIAFALGFVTMIMLDIGLA